MGDSMKPRLFATAIKEIGSQAVGPMDRFADNYLFSSAIVLLTDHPYRAYELRVTPLGSFGERVRSRPIRGGSCFINSHHSDPDQLVSQAACTMTLLVIRSPIIYLMIHLVCRVDMFK